MRLHVLAAGVSILTAILSFAAVAAETPGAQIARHTVYTADMDRSIAFWVEGLGYKVRSDMPGLGGPLIEKSFRLKPDGKMRFVVLEPADRDGLLVGLMSSVGQPFVPLARDPDGPPRAGETFVLVRVPDVQATFAKLKNMGIAVNQEPVLIPSGTVEGSVITPEGNRMVIQQARKL